MKRIKNIKKWIKKNNYDCSMTIVIHAKADEFPYISMSSTLIHFCHELNSDIGFDIYID